MASTGGSVLVAQYRWLSTGGSVPPATATSLQPGHAQQKQHDDGADDRAEYADGAEVVGLDLVELDELPQESADERPHNAEQDCADDADIVPARHEQAGNEADDQSDDDEKNYERNHAEAGTRFPADYARPQLRGPAVAVPGVARGRAVRFGEGRPGTLT